MKRRSAAGAAQPAAAPVQSLHMLVALRRLTVAGIAALGTAAGCFAESSTLGLPCSDETACGTGQVCAMGHCVQTSHCAYTQLACGEGLTCDPCSELSGGCVAAAECPVCPGEETPCIEHSDCTCSACNLGTGRCRPEGRIYVDRVDPNCEQGDGSVLRPVCTVQRGLELARCEGFETLVVRPGFGPYDAALHIEPGESLALIGNPDRHGANTERPTLRGSVDDEAIRVGGELDIANALLSLGTPLVRCHGGRVSLTDVSLERASPALDAVGCDVLVRRSIVHSAIAGLDIKAGQLRLENTVIAPQAEYGVGIDASYEIVYSSLLGTRAPSLVCENGASGSIRNSVILDGLEPGFGVPQASCDVTTIENSLVNAEHAGGASNSIVDPPGSGLFESLATGDYHLALGREVVFQGVARHREGDPTDDFERDDRRARPGESAYAGADHPAAEP